MPKEGIHPRVHSKYLDKELGYKTSKIENKLSQIYRPYDLGEDPTNRKKHFQGAQAWIGLHPQALQTTYNEVFAVFKYLSQFDIQKVIDIGAGYGRVGLVMSSFFPKADFFGIEIIPQRVIEGNRIFEKFNLKNCEMIYQDVCREFESLPKADVYFIYDFSEESGFDFVLEKIFRKREENFFLVTHGERTDNLMKKKYKGFWHRAEIVSNTRLRIYQFPIQKRSEI